MFGLSRSILMPLPIILAVFRDLYHANISQVAAFKAVPYACRHKSFCALSLSPSLALYFSPIHSNAHTHTHTSTLSPQPVCSHSLQNRFCLFVSLSLFLPPASHLALALDISLLSHIFFLCLSMHVFSLSLSLPPPPSSFPALCL